MANRTTRTNRAKRATITNRTHMTTRAKITTITPRTNMINITHRATQNKYTK